MASKLPKKVLIFGTTGVIGKFITQEVVNARSSFDKIGLFTSPETARNKPNEINYWEEKGVDINVGDVNSEEDVKKAYEGAALPNQAYLMCSLAQDTNYHRLRHHHLSPRPQRNLNPDSPLEAC